MTGPRIPPTLSPDRSVAFVDAIYRVIEGTGAIADARTLLVPDVSSWTEQHLFPFLDETHLTLAGGDFCNDFDVCDRENRQLGASWRAWGGIVADWANARGWPAKHVPERRRWDYIDFYMLEHYRDFVRVTHDVMNAAP